MVSKREILEMYCSLDMTVTEVARSMYDLECRVEKLEKKLCKCEKACPKKSDKKVRAALKDLKKALAETEPKRGRGRPRKNA